MLLIGGAFTALLLLLSRLSDALGQKSSSTNNLTVSCTNPNVSLSWEFSELQTHTEFKIDVRGSDNRLVWKSEAHFMAFYGVNVTAFQGGNQSKEAKTTFTFNGLKEAHVNCQLDFPDVYMVEKDSGATLSFMNPLHYYKKLNQVTIESDGASFTFQTASSETGHFNGHCNRQEKNCELHIEFPADVEMCETLKGELLGIIGGQVVFRQTDSICAEPEEKELTVALVVLLFVLGIVIVVIIIIIIKIPREGEDGLLLIKEDLTPISVVTLFNNPVNTSSVSSEEEEEEEKSRDNNREDNSRDNNRDNNREDNSRDNNREDNSRDNNRDNNREDNSRDNSRDNNREDNSRDNNREDREGLQPLDAAYSDGVHLEENMKDEDDSALSSKEEEEDSTDSSTDSSGYLSRERVLPLDAVNSRDNSRDNNREDNSRDNNREDREGLQPLDAADDSAKTETVSIESVESIRSHYDRPHALQVEIGDRD
ncbi:Interferon gamma receptor 1 [Dissostichus eleginoides]|uniref:Interferon gamma receptor 1 n=1 Tax=Dissostichus eleginoides TaxID=100907 RepID=A0AAD9BMH4_DISEL|nr:Interferon gamma receptor 1 [Dissostichus eleginoides]